MDVVSLVFNLECWILYGSVIVAILLMVYSILLKKSGDENANKYFLSGLAAILIGCSGGTLLDAFIGSSTFYPLAVGDWIYYALIGACFVSAVVYFAVGKFEKGIWHLGATFLLIMFLLLIPVIIQETGIDPGMINIGGLIVNVEAEPGHVIANEETTIKVTIKDDYYSWKVRIDFGDGSVGEYTTNSNVFTVKHAYAKEGSYGISVKVQRIDQPVIGVGFTAVVVHKPIPIFGWIFARANDLLDKALNQLSSFLNFPVAMIYLLPMLEPGTDAYNLYEKIVGISLIVFILYLIFGIVHNIFTREAIDFAVVDSLKEAVYVLVIIFLAPYLYNLSAGILNAIGSLVADKIDLTPIYAGLVGYIALAILSGYFVPYVSDLLSNITTAMLIASAMCIAKYWLVLALVVASPILAVSYLHPAFRGAVRFYLGILTGLMLAGPIAAIMLALVSMWLKSLGPNGYILYVLASPIMLVLFPVAIGMSLSGNIMGWGFSLTRIMTGFDFGGILSRHRKTSSGSPTVSDIGSRSTTTPVVTVNPAGLPKSTKVVSTSSRIIPVKSVSPHQSVGRAIPTISTQVTTSKAIGEEFHDLELIGHWTRLGETYIRAGDGLRSRMESYWLSKADTTLKGKLMRKLTEVRMRFAVSKIDTAKDGIAWLSSRVRTNLAELRKEYARRMLYHYHVITGHIHPKALRRYYIEPLDESLMDGLNYFDRTSYHSH